MEDQFIRDRLTQLRQMKQVSERKMSLDLGHSTSYVRSITSGKALPSMREFLYICEYLEISPIDFFTEETQVPLTPLQQEAINRIRTMSDIDIQAIITFMEKLNPTDQ